MRRLWITGLISLIVAALLGGCSESPGESAKPQAAAEVKSYEDGAAALPEELPVIDLAGLEALIVETAASDRVLVIDFWATWCVPCVQMFPQIHEGLHAMGDGVRPVTVTFDSRGEYERRAIEFLDRHHALKDAYILPTPDAQTAVVNGLGERWQHLVVPAILVFDRQGKLRHEFLEGGVTDRVLAAARALMDEPADADPDGTAHADDAGAEDEQSL